MMTVHRPLHTNGRLPQQAPIATDRDANRAANGAGKGAADGAVVCHVLHSLNVGGAEVLAARLARRLSDRFRFVFACLDELGTLGEQLRQEGFTVEVLGRKGGVDLKCAGRLSRFVRSQGVGVIHAHQYTPFFYALLSGVLRRRSPVLFTEHGRHFPDFRRPKRVLFNKLFLRGRDRVVGVGESVRQALIDHEGIAPNRVGVIYNGVDLTEFDCGADRIETRREIGLQDDDEVLLQVARLDALKDHSTALRTIERLAASRPNVRLVLVGEGPERATIESEIQRRGLESHVRLLGLRSDVAQLLAAADVFLLSSVSEGIPVTLIEAMMARVPVVSTRVGGVAEVIADGTTGLLAPSGSDGALAEAVTRLLDDPPLRAQMGAAGQARAEEIFSQRQMHASYASQYEELSGVRR